MIVAGVDEAGRGPLAGPVLVSAVILDPSRPIDGLNDSKKLTAARRDELFELVLANALEVSVVEVDVMRIDSLNILHATMWGMREAVMRLRNVPMLALLDGNRVPKEMPVETRAIVKGDALEPAIMAASIVAKVTRDRLMCELANQYPGYGFEIHKGYPTPTHLASLRELGACAIHRRSFAPVREAISGAVKTAEAQAELIL